MKTVFINNNSDKIIVLFCGWAVDEKPFRIFNDSKYDVLCVFDYSDITFSFDFSKYKYKYLIAFSYGVFISSLIWNNFKNFDKKIALNGTLKPVDKDFGIAPKIFNLTLKSLNEESLKKFYTRMFDNNLDAEYFIENIPSVSPENAEKELENIYKISLENIKSEAFFDKIYVSDSDKIIPKKSQLNFWEGQNTEIINAGHFLFYKFNSLADILDINN